jgi:hypothetical protein
MMKVAVISAAEVERVYCLMNRIATNKKNCVVNSEYFSSHDEGFGKTLKQTGIKHHSSNLGYHKADDNRLVNKVKLNIHNTKGLSNVSFILEYISRI